MVFHNAVVILTRNEKNQRVLYLPISGRRIGFFRTPVDFSTPKSMDSFPTLIKNYGITSQQVSDMCSCSRAVKTSFTIRLPKTIEGCRQMTVHVVKIAKGCYKPSNDLHMYNCEKPTGYEFKILDGVILREMLQQLDKFSSKRV